MFVNNKSWKRVVLHILHKVVGSAHSLSTLCSEFLSIWKGTETWHARVGYSYDTEYLRALSDPASQEIPCTFLNLKVHCHVNMSPHVDCILSQMNWVHSPSPPRFVLICIYICVAQVVSYCQVSQPKFGWISCLIFVFSMFLLSLPFWFDHPNNT